MPGPAPKAHGRQRHNSVTLTVLGRPTPITTTPPPPPGLLASSRASWARLWSSELAAVLTEMDFMALRRLWTLRDERQRCYQGLRKQRIVAGAKGQPVLSPLFRAITSLDVSIVALEDRCGLTPRSRLKLGVTFGDAARSLADLMDDEVDDMPDPRLSYAVQP